VAPKVSISPAQAGTEKPYTYERPTSLLAVGLELILILLSAQRPPQTIVRVSLIRMGIDDIVWDVNGIKIEYTGNGRGSQSRFFDRGNPKMCS